MPDMDTKPYDAYLTERERADLASWREMAKQRRDDANVYSRWCKQVVDRATQRMKKEKA